MYNVEEQRFIVTPPQDGVTAFLVTHSGRGTAGATATGTSIGTTATVTVFRFVTFTEGIELIG
jgi:hypothetical protein